MKKNTPHLRLSGSAILRIGVALALISWAGWSLYQYMQNQQSASNTSVPAAATTGGTPDKKTQDEKNTYEVPPDHPRELLIPILGVDANILPMGVTAEGAMEAPKSAWDTGWYNKSALPGSGAGALIIDGHVNSTLGNLGVFYSLARLQNGDPIIVERGDHKKFTYTVRQVTQVPLEQVDMSELMRSIDPSAEGISLITCGGLYDKDKQTYVDRVIVRGILSS